MLFQFVQISHLRFKFIYFKVMEDETYVFTSSLLSLLAEFGIRPPLFDASCLSNFTKVQILFEHFCHHYFQKVQPFYP